MAPSIRVAMVTEAGIVETVEGYARRWCDWRKKKGLGCAEADRVALARHVLPRIGSLDVRTIARDDLKRLVTALNDKARAGVGSDGRSFGVEDRADVWMVVRAPFRDARAAKDVTLCVRNDNPAEGVAAPDTGTRKRPSASSLPCRWIVTADAGDDGGWRTGGES